MNPLKLDCLLGLGHKFCIQEERPQRGALDTTFERFDRKIQLKYTFAGHASKDDYDKKIYVKSSWDTGLANNETEDILSIFQQNIWEVREISLTRPCATNLSKHQFNIVKHLRAN